MGIVRTTKEEFASLEDEAWWMHERCMAGSDLIDYYGGKKALARARAAAEEEEKLRVEAAKAGGAASSKSTGKKQSLKEKQGEKLKAMSVKDLKQFLEKHKIDASSCVEKEDLLAKALQVVASFPDIPEGPAWIPAGVPCRLCTKEVKQEKGGVICRRLRADGSVAGCSQAICWRCMKRAPRESFGKVRTTKEEFESLEDDAWWMHEACFEEGDYKDYFGESEPEDEKRKREERASGEGEWTAAWA